MRCQPHLRGPVVGTVGSLRGPVGYFYDGLSEANRRAALPENTSDGGEMFTRKETMDLIRAYYQVSERSRCRLLDLAKSLHGGIGESDAA